MKTGIAFALFALPVIAAAAPDCSVRTTPNLAGPEFFQKAKVTPGDAERAAVRSLGNVQPQIVRHALEVERNCLVYSVDVAIPGKRGFEQVRIDAGDGKVLGRRHESARTESREWERKAGPRTE